MRTANDSISITYFSLAAICLDSGYKSSTIRDCGIDLRSRYRSGQMTLFPAESRWVKTSVPARCCKSCGKIRTRRWGSQMSAERLVFGCRGTPWKASRATCGLLLNTRCYHLLIQSTIVMWPTLREDMSLQFYMHKHTLNYQSMLTRLFTIYL